MPGGSTAWSSWMVNLCGYRTSSGELLHLRDAYELLLAVCRSARTGHRRQMREAILHLAFEGLGAKEASSDAFVDNDGSNAISRDLGGNQTGRTWLHGTASPHF